MPEMQYCYCCRVHHPQSEMRLFPTRHGERWRCLRSIEAAAASRQSRDAFGQEQSRINRELARRQADFAHFSRRHQDSPRPTG
ncbi:hypothetical protein VX159_02480 [Dechloromonas sp. ZY10]|uniref:hypothetical protein n=1 Tax=Dechloromonas aquae TaxID=2664436 RepID=UPI0035271660